MSSPAASVVVATRDRPQSLAETLSLLEEQRPASWTYEVVVVDDGSERPVALPASRRVLRRLLRLTGKGRSAARNQGAEEARGDLLIFVDDDISVPSTFVEGHLRAQRDWPGVLGAGAIRLADSMTSTPFGRFRRRLEEKGVPVERGFVDRPNFCAAGNMSLPRSTFRELGGFDQELTDGEDQDLALRHSARGGRIAFLPDVPAIHRDEAVDFPRYLRRVEAGAERLVAFCRRHPDWPDNRERMRVNGPVRLGREPLAESAQKIAKTALGTAWAEALLLRMVGVLETRAPGSGALERLYSVLLGVRLRRGFRRGLAEVLRAERS